MIAELYKNVDLVQINIKTGVSEYTFPKNVDWADKNIDRLVLVAPTATMVSPIDGVTAVMTKTQVETANLFFDLYTADEKDLAQSLHYSNLIYTNSHQVRIDSKLSLQTSRIFFTTAPVADACLLLYAFYDSKTVEDYDMPRRSRTIDVELAANEQKSFKDIIARTFYADGYKVRGLEIYGGEVKPTYLTLRDHELSYVINSLYSGLCRPQLQGATAEATQKQMFLLDEQNIDFENSFIRNAVNSANTQHITIYY